MNAAASPTSIARPDILSVDPYEHALWNPALVRLHANELPWRHADDTSAAGLNRYPEPQPHELVAQLAALYEQSTANVLVTRGSDEAIDLLTRAFCRAGTDQVLVCPPTFGMYAVAARIQGAGVVRVPLRQTQGFALDVAAVLAQCTPTVKLVYLCSPNNPTGNLIPEGVILQLAGELAWDFRYLLVPSLEHRKCHDPSRWLVSKFHPGEYWYQHVRCDAYVPDSWQRDRDHPYRLQYAHRRGLGRLCGWWAILR